MHFPYQRLAVVEVGSSSEYLVAAAGCRLLVTNAEGDLTSEWTSSEDRTKIEEISDRPAKRRKIGEHASRIINITSTSGYNHILVVTEDKNINVLRLSNTGQLIELSRRCMPKRPCAVQLLVQEQLILCADKHGDVYSLPLIPNAEEDAKYANGISENQSVVAKTFVPSATALTVHTKRNRMALASQQQQKVFTQKKAPLAFEHKLLLGHVSMLTDVAFVRSDKHRNRIITSDRDEHIRISRPPPQAYVIEGFCFGHVEFVSKLCPIEGTTLVASGGGDDWIGIWDWTTYELKHKIDVKHAFQMNGVDTGNTSKIAVSTLRYIPYLNAIVVLCERIRAIALIDVDSEQIIVHKESTVPLDAVAYGGRIVISFDVRKSSADRLVSYDCAKDKGFSRVDQPVTITMNTQDLEDDGLKDELIDQALYSIADLRKRGDLDEAAEHAED